MLALSPIKTEPVHQQEDNRARAEEFPDFSDGSLLESIDFDDLFLGVDDGDVLPDLEMDPELLAELSASYSGSGEDSDGTTNTSLTAPAPEKYNDDKINGSRSALVAVGDSEEFLSKQEELAAVNSSGKDGEKSSKNSHGKRKVDWTPELHRRFVQAVEQLGVEKAVPSRILEIMGIDCLTRHNIASHLQKYRSHKKHLQAREAEAARWTHMRQMYNGGKRGVNPWLAPTMGFPPVAPMHHHFRPLHVWGHPPVDQSMLHTWPKHLLPLPPTTAQPSPIAPSPPMDPSYWSHHPVCYPQPIPPATRFAAPTVPGIPPHPMYKLEAGIGNSVFECQPSTETIDAVIGDVITKPWLPLPLGLKPPSVDGVLGELLRQGVPKIPPPSCS